MSLFCLLWTPLFYLFRRSLSADTGSVGGVWALILGSIVALVQFFFGSLVEPGGFGLSRWISACVDIVSLPAILPLLVYLLFIMFQVLPGPVDFANFALLWLIPGAAMRAVSWSAQSDPSLLVLVPLLWTAIVVGIPFFIGLAAGERFPIVMLAGIGVLALPFAAATAWWAFFSQKFLLGFVLLGITLLPLGISTGTSFLRGGD